LLRTRDELIVCRPQARPHMRLRAVQCVFKLANVRAFDKTMGDFYEPISLVAQVSLVCMLVSWLIAYQDPHWAVRNKILLKLGEILPTQRLMPRWNIMPVMIANDPEADHIALVGTAYHIAVGNTDSP
jgi:sister-chromatid-cohesion protein PDS5